MSTTLARVVTGLTDQEIQHIFHALKREGGDLPPPSELDLIAWRERQYGLLDRARRMSDTRRDDLRNKLFRTRSEPTPDGATFYAWSRVEARARQEVAIRTIPDAVDLAPPGSQRDQYELDAEGLPAKVWYASYGSNLHRDRFLTYIHGGRPEGSSRFYDGARDHTVPDEDIAIRIAGARPHFALTSRVWHGGIAFIDAHKGETATGLGRAYKVTREQFEDVVAQENGLRAGECSDIPYADVLDSGRNVTGPGPYETLLHIGDHEGAPVLTFTAPFSTRDALGRKGQVTRAGVRMPVLTNRPSAAYVRMIGSGLAETFGMDEVAQADYLRGCPGGDRYTRQEMVRMLRERPAPNPAAGGTQAGRPVSAGAWNSDWDTRPNSSPTSDSEGVYTGEVVYTKKATDPPRARSRGGSRGGRSGTSASRSLAADASSKAPKPTKPARPKRQEVNPRRQGKFPPVKTYGSGQEKEDGLRRWNASLNDWRHERRIAEAVLANAPESAKADAQHRYEVACHAVDELNAKVRYAKSQKPANWYSTSPRSSGYWEAERAAIHRKIFTHNKQMSVAFRAAEYWEGTSSPRREEYVAGHQARADRALSKIVALEGRLEEVQQRLRESRDRAAEPERA